MNSKDAEVLKKIHEHAVRVIKHGSGCKNYQDFANADMVSDACIFNIMQIGELAKNELSEEAKDEITSIPWKKIYGMRNRIVHGYSNMDMRIIWDTIQDNIPQLETEVNEILRRI